MTNIKTLDEVFYEDIQPETILDNLDELTEIFPEIAQTVSELRIKLNSANCKVCQRNKYLIIILNDIKNYYQDGRDLGNLKNLVESMISKYFPYYNHNLLNNQNEFDITWVKPDVLVGLGRDLINGLTSCFECCKKHLSRAKIFYEEWKQGYPEHSTLMYQEFTEANKTLEEGYVLFWDSLGQLDMASNELVGSHFSDLDSHGQIELIELANKIRAARIAFQEDSEKVPDFDKLRIEVQKVQNKLNKLKEIAKKYNLLMSGGSDYHGENVKQNVKLFTGCENVNVSYEDILIWVKDISYLTIK